jgi:hypothetical protein
MSAVTWLVVIAFAALMLGILVKTLLRHGISDEEFERQAKRPSLLRAGLQEFQGFLEPEKKAAYEVVEQEKRKTDVQTQGEPPRGGAAGKSN